MIDLYHEDNLTVLPRLATNSIQLIYSDILFGTNKDFHDYSDKIDIERFYIPRFVEMRRVLSNTGLLYIHTDTTNGHYIKVILDQIFGRAQFRNEIIWYFNSSPRRKKDFGKRHHTIFRYSKSDDYVFYPIRVPYSKSAPRGYAKEQYYHPDGKVMDDVWIINSLGQNDKHERTGYATQKPVALLDYIICSSSKEGDTVADFFLGSGTTAVSALKNGRIFIGVDINERAIQITKERIKQYY